MAVKKRRLLDRLHIDAVPDTDTLITNVEQHLSDFVRETMNRSEAECIEGNGCAIHRQILVPPAMARDSHGLMIRKSVPGKCLQQAIRNYISLRSDGGSH